MKRFILSALLSLPLAANAAPIVEMLIIDLSGALPNEVYTDAATPGSVGTNSVTSAILGTYWTTGSIQVAVANNQIGPIDEAELINASINLDAAPDPLGTNVGVIISATEFDLGTNDVEAFTIINAATVDETAFDAAVFVDAVEILDVDNIITTDTFTGTKLLAVGDTFDITHAFDLTALAEGGDLGFDISTTVRGVPVPAPLALLGLGLAALGVTRRLR